LSFAAQPLQQNLEQFEQLEREVISKPAKQKSQFNSFAFGRGDFDKSINSTFVMVNGEFGGETERSTKVTCGPEELFDERFGFYFKLIMDICWCNWRGIFGGII